MSKSNPEQREAETVEMLKNVANYGGGPAFPQQMQWMGADKTSNFWFAVGLTKREQFAMAAMQGWLASYGDDRQFPLDAEQEDLAARCCQMADALLERLKK